MPTLDPQILNAATRAGLGRVAALIELQEGPGGSYMKNQRGVRINSHFAGNWGTRPHEIYSAAKAKALSCINDPAEADAPRALGGRQEWPMKVFYRKAPGCFICQTFITAPASSVVHFSFPSFLRSLWRAFSALL